MYKQRLHEVHMHHKESFQLQIGAFTQVVIVYLFHDDYKTVRQADDETQLLHNNLYDHEPNLLVHNTAYQRPLSCTQPTITPAFQ